MWLHIEYKNYVKRYGKFLQWALCMCKCLAGLFISWQVWQDHRSNIPYLNSLICPVPLSVQLSIPLFHKFLVVSINKFCSLCMKMSRISQYWKSHRKIVLSCKNNHGGRLINAITSLHHSMFLVKKYSCYSYLSKIFSKRYHTFLYYMGIFCTCSSVIWVSKGFNMQTWGMNVVPVVSDSIARCWDV